MTHYVKNNPTLLEELLKAVVRKANGVFVVSVKLYPDALLTGKFFRFLFAQLHMNSLAREDNLRSIREALANLPEELNVTYDEIMQRIWTQDIRKAKKG